MKNRYTLLLGILTIGLMLFSASSSGVIAQETNPVNINKVSSENWEIATGNVTISVVGGENVPMYSIWQADQNDTKYRVQFKQVFEYHDNNNNSVYDQNDTRVAGPPYALAALSWDFSEVTSDDNGSHFNISSSDGLFTFANHIGDNASSLKFDVIISEAFEFKTNDSMLALSFQLTKNNGTTNETEQEDNRVAFDDAFFEIKNTAEADNDTIDVGLSSTTSENSSVAYISYPQFEGEMIHDPTIGIDETSSDDASDELSLGMNTLFVSAIALLVPVITYKINKKEN